LINPNHPIRANGKIIPRICNLCPRNWYTYFIKACVLNCFNIFYGNYLKEKFNLIRRPRKRTINPIHKRTKVVDLYESQEKAIKYCIEKLLAKQTVSKAWKINTHLKACAGKSPCRLNGFGGFLARIVDNLKYF